MICDNFEVSFQSLLAILKELIGVRYIVQVFCSIWGQVWDGATLVLRIAGEQLMQLFKIVEASFDTVLLFGVIEIADPVLGFYFIKCRRTRPRLLRMEARNSDDNLVLGHCDPSIA